LLSGSKELLRAMGELANEMKEIVKPTLGGSVGIAILTSGIHPKNWRLRIKSAWKLSVKKG